MRKLLALLVLLLPIALHAQTATIGATVKFTAPTQHTDATPITGALTYIAQSGPKGGTKTRLATPVSPAGTTIPNITPGTCFQVIAVEAGVESSPSNEACLPMPPNAATGLTVTVTISINSP